METFLITAGVEQPQYKIRKTEWRQGRNPITDKAKQRRRHQE
jgi:hypothetical protein